LKQAEISAKLERLLMVTLSLEEACSGDDATLIRQLLDKRDGLLDELQGVVHGQEEYRPMLSRIAEVDRRMLAKLEAEFDAICARLARRSASEKARAVYAGAPPRGPRFLERSG
jgi:hypothetical protein